MKLPTFDDERIACLATHDCDDDLEVLLVDVVEDAEIAEPKLIAGQWVGPEQLDGFAGDCRLILETGGDAFADDPLLPGREVLQLSLGLLSNCYAMGHTSCESKSNKQSGLPTVGAVPRVSHGNQNPTYRRWAPSQGVRAPPAPYHRSSADHPA